MRAPVTRALAAVTAGVMLAALLGLGLPTAGAAGVTLGSLSPVSGSPGTVLTVSGSGFSGASDLQASVGGETVAVTVVSDSALSFAVPADARSGTTSVVIEENGVALLPSLTFTVFTLAALPLGEAGAPYGASLSVSGGTPPYSYEVVTGALASGLFLSSAGTFSGSAKSPGTSTFTVTVTDAAHLSATFAVSPPMSPGPSVTTSSLGAATVGTAFSVTLAATAGTPPYSWSIGSGPIPGGLVLSSSGVLAGRPGQTGQYSVELKVTDARRIELGQKTQPRRLAPGPAGGIAPRHRGRCRRDPVNVLAPRVDLDGRG